LRPCNPAVPVNSPESPLVRHQKNGVKLNIPVMIESPTANVITNLLESFRRLEPRL
jgi:hypothetical protein